MIKSYLPEEGWNVVFSKGRDSMTGQDVALLTKFEVIENSITNYKNTQGQDKPSKILGVGLNVGSRTMDVIVVHFISKRSQNDSKRLGQADFVRQQVIIAENDFDHIVIMGDMNDLPDSPTLQRLRGLDDSSSDYIQTAITTGQNPAYSYVYNDEQQLIDHIILSPSLTSAFESINPESRHWSINLGPISDHRAVMAIFNLE